jgi:two-component system KDP operon response regulator KdpE
MVSLDFFEACCDHIARAGLFSSRGAVLSERPKILVVDDEAQITRVLRTTLPTHGYEVQVANDGEAALAVLNAWRPDLVITDLVMPNMNGIELCENIRDRSQVPIIVLSVRGEEKSKVEALDKGADDYVTKPFNTNELLARIRANLRRRAAARAEEGVEPRKLLKIDWLEWWS